MHRMFVACCPNIIIKNVWAMFSAVYELHWRALASRMLTLMTTLRIYRYMYERARFVFFFLHPKQCTVIKPKGISRMPLNNKYQTATCYFLGWFESSGVAWRWILSEQPGWKLRIEDKNTKKLLNAKLSIMLWCFLHMSYD